MYMHPSQCPPVPQLIAQPSGPGAALEVPVEVIIGTIPFRKTEQGTPMLTVKAAAKAADEGGLSVSSGFLS